MNLTIKDYIENIQLALNSSIANYKQKAMENPTNDNLESYGKMLAAQAWFQTATMATAPLENR